ncbi:MAG: translation initiation factor [Euryarchaeota archaeon]|nr:translation initiation factor [Euryarchaeota archaeon]
MTAAVVCEVCGLPKEICVCEELSREQAPLRVRMDTRRYGKPVTVVEGFADDANVDALAKELKRKVAAGGTVKNGHIELQGDHRHKVVVLLRDKGYTVEEVR